VSWHGYPGIGGHVTRAAAGKHARTGSGNGREQNMNRYVGRENANGGPYVSILEGWDKMLLEGCNGHAARIV
jgi:hypothetical protein